MGGAGLLGRILISRLFEWDTNVIRVLDQNEAGWESLERTLNIDRCRFLAEDVRGKEAMTNCRK